MDKGAEEIKKDAYVVVLAPRSRSAVFFLSSAQEDDEHLSRGDISSQNGLVLGRGRGGGKHLMRRHEH